jgi:hypothetical protein
MGRTVRTAVTIIFVAVVVGIALAVLYLGSLTGLVFGGQSTVTGSATAKSPFYAQVGWLKNTAPWPLTIKSVSANAAHSNKTVSVWAETRQVGPLAVTDGKVPVWASPSGALPVDLNGGGLRYLGWALSPAEGEVASFSSITVTFSGPLGFTFHKTFTGAQVAAASASLPDGILATDPTVDSTSLNGYVAAMRNALLKRNLANLAIVMGGGATASDAKVFLASQRGYATADKLAVVTTPGDSTKQRLEFYLTNPTRDALKPFNIQWVGFRWSVIRA